MEAQSALLNCIQSQALCNHSVIYSNTNPNLNVILIHILTKGIIGQSCLLSLRQEHSALVYSWRTLYLWSGDCL